MNLLEAANRYIIREYREAWLPENFDYHLFTP